jgi:hypothetical protein
MSLWISTTTQGKDLHVAIEGFIDENCLLPEFPDEIAGKMVINLEKIFMINSLGSRLFRKWLTNIRARGGVVLAHCSEPFISQINVLQNFIPDGVTVESFQVPYPCAKCEVDGFALFTPGKDTDMPASRVCPSCGATASLGVIKAEYFNFLSKKVA